MARPETKAPEPEEQTVDVRVLSDYDGFRINTVATVTRSRAAELEAIGAVDSNSEAVAYLRSLEQAD